MAKCEVNSHSYTFALRGSRVSMYFIFLSLLIPGNIGIETYLKLISQGSITNIT